MLQFVQTADGSNTIYNDEVGENYHSTHGALQESQHVFINAGLKYFLDRGSSEISSTGEDLQMPISILEVGFGTGLNFLLSADVCTEHEIQLTYAGIEAYPLSLEMLNQTRYGNYVSPAVWETFIKNYSDSLLNNISLNNYCQLQIAHCKLADFQSNQQYDIIYFDAFASARQPEMWDETAIAHTIQFLKPGGVFVTYAITGNLKRALKALGCKVEKVPGALGKREMLRATQQDTIAGLKD